MQTMAHTARWRVWVPALLALGAFLLLLLATEAQGQRKAKSGKEVVSTACVECHATGKDAAPKIGDRAAWIPRMSRGLDALVASAIQGHASMPARGGLANVTDQELRESIVYMFNYGLPETPTPPPAAATAKADPFHKLVDGTDVYLGLMPADALRRAAVAEGRSRAEREKIPKGRDQHHVNISLVDSASKAPIKDATVTLRVSNGFRSETHKLSAMTSNQAVSYGGYFQISGGNAYVITADIQRPGTAEGLQAKFDYRAP